MSTTNISIPPQLKSQASQLVKDGHYSSFSDLARTAIRQLLLQTKNDFMAYSAISEHSRGESYVLRDSGDVKKYMDKITQDK